MSFEAFNPPDHGRRIQVNGLTVVKCLGSTEVARDWPLLPSLGSSKASDFSVSECCLPTDRLLDGWFAGLRLAPSFVRKRTPGRLLLLQCGLGFLPAQRITGNHSSALVLGSGSP